MRFSRTTVVGERTADLTPATSPAHGRNTAMAKAAAVIAVAAAPILAMATAASAVSVAHDSQSAVIAAEGPNHSLDFYWNIDGTATCPS